MLMGPPDVRSRMCLATLPLPTFDLDRDHLGRGPAHAAGDAVRDLALPSAGRQPVTAVVGRRWAVQDPGLRPQQHELGPCPSGHDPNRTWAEVTWPGTFATGRPEDP